MELECKKCNRTLPEEMFRKQSIKWYKSRNGRGTVCKECEYGYIPLEFRQVRTCIACNETKSIEDFRYSNKERGYRVSYCKSCQNKNTEKRRGYKGNRERNLRTKFKIDSSDYLKLLELQEYKCKICGITLEEYKEAQKSTKINNVGQLREFSIDHCHTTGKIRGLLCNSCNTGLGCFKDSSELLQKAIEYLNSTQQ